MKSVSDKKGVLMVRSASGAALQEHLDVINDAEPGGNRVIAIHSTARGPAAGGCRLWRHPAHTKVLGDAVHVAREMSYKSERADIALGGGDVFQKPDTDFDPGTIFRRSGDMSCASALVQKLGATCVDPEEMPCASADILVSCALGGVLNANPIPSVRAQRICGDANNQLGTQADGEALLARGIFDDAHNVVNAAGFVNVSAEDPGETSGEARERVSQTAERFLDIPAQTAEVRISPAMDGICAQQIIANTPTRKAA